jgi:hypothetical protein
MANVPPVFPPVGGVGDSDLTAADQDYYLRLLDRLFPDNYLAQMKVNPNSGYEQFQGYASLGERLSTAITRLGSDNVISYAPGGTRATGFVNVSRPTGAAGTVTVLAGSVVTCSVGGQDFVTTIDMAFSGAATGPLEVPVVAIASGYEWNVRGQRTTAGGETLAGEIDTFKRLVTDPPYGDPTIYVEQVNDITNGVAAVLDGLGSDRGMARTPGETTDQFRLRLHTLPDVVSPGAIKRVCHALLDPLGIAFQFIETGDIAYQTCWDAPSSNPGTPTYQPIAPANLAYDSDLFTYDDPRDDTDPYRNRWLDEVEMRGAFIIVLDNVSLNDLGLAYDDSGLLPSDYRDPITGFGRGTPAFDITSAIQLVAPVYTAAYDGFDLGYNAITSALWQVLKAIKAGGVIAILERRSA